jgi:hypothetical protein
MATANFGPRAYLANAAISAFRAVVLSVNGGVGLAGNGQVPDGFAQVDAASADYASVRHFFDGGTQKGVLTASPVTVGDALYAGATGYVSTTGTITVGKSLTTTGGAANAANGSVVEFIPRVTVIA